EAVRAHTEDKRGPDAVVEAAGNPTAWRTALSMVRRGGVINFFSGLPSGTKVEIEPATIHYSEIRIISTFHHTPRFIREALEAVRRGEISAHDFVTEEIRLADLPQAFERMKSRSGEIKLAVRPWIFVNQVRLNLNSSWLLPGRHSERSLRSEESLLSMLRPGELEIAQNASPAGCSP